MKKERLLAELRQICDVKDDWLKESNAYMLTFWRGRARVSIRIAFEDEQSGADLLFTNMTTQPDSEKNLGNGSVALQEVLRLGQLCDFKKIIATQVQSPSKSFWQRNGFVPLHDATNDFAFIPTHDAYGKRLPP